MPLPKTPLLTFVVKLSKYPIITNLEQQTSVPKTYVVLGLAASYFFFIFFNIGGQLLTNFAGFVIPGYYSLEALFTPGRADDTQWLTVSAGANKDSTPVPNC
jgi:receptor expression-enhancing protein 5/6